MLAARRRADWTERLLGLCLVAIAMVWIAAVAHFRAFTLQPIHWAVVAAAAFAVQVVLRRLMGRRRPPQLPAGTTVARVAAWLALLFALITFTIGGLVEYVAQQRFPSETPWGLRTTWHAACAFGGAYCLFLQRLLAGARSRG